MTENNAATEEFDWTFSPEDKSIATGVAYFSLKRALTKYRDRLISSSQSGELDYVAWTARNLLELMVWVEYCARSRENAEDFLWDTVRDMADVARKVGSEPEALAVLESMKVLVGVARPAHKYKAVSAAAAETGLSKLYEDSCKRLSKFVHPTALSLFAPLPPASAALIRQEFCEMGENFAADSLKTLDASFMHDLFETHRSTIHAAFAAMPENERPFEVPS